MRLAPHVIRDVLHGYIPHDDLDRALIDTPIVQRLRYIRQNDVAYLVYPSLNTTRFEHSLGVMHVAGLLAESAVAGPGAQGAGGYLDALLHAIPDDSGAPHADARDIFIRAARWYGLLHDVGHLPLSHLVEHCLADQMSVLYPDTRFAKLHEAAGEYLVQHNPGLREVFDRDPAAGWLVRQLMSAKSATPVLQPLKDIVDGEVDADRIDSTARDGLQSGGDYGHYDISRLTRHAMLNRRGDRWRMLFTTRAVSAIESLLVERCKTYRWIHYKPKVVAFKNAFRHCLASVPFDPARWHADRYVQACGYLDDAHVMGLLGEVNAVAPIHAQRARDAILRRANTARPLWKRRDEFRRISGLVAAKLGDIGLRLFDPKFPVLNILATTWVAPLEGALNQGGPRDVYYLVSKTHLEPFEPRSRGSRIGSYEVLGHQRLDPILLTDESRMVKSLRDVMMAEAEIGVTVLCAADDPRTPADFEEHFVRVAAEMLGQWRTKVTAMVLNDMLKEIQSE
ncbi:MAG: HD domain-containing protein [Planctomycetes bacterium]|nr:HD domain-containing protein [Planctomycetota bacterium]